jgi:hypothetical protein
MSKAEVEKPVHDPGIFVTKGMKITISNIKIPINPDGKIVPEPVTLSTGLDLCPYWLEIAYEHLLNTEQASINLINAKSVKNNEAIGIALQTEFVAGMQAMMASAIAIDAFYASVKNLVEIPDETIHAWQIKNTARYSQVAEVFRRAFTIKSKSFGQLRKILKEIYRFRDLAVHPPSGTRTPALHSELNMYTDWRYAAFRFSNAKISVGNAISIISQLSNKSKNDKLKAYCEELKAQLHPLLERWESHYEKLF